MYKAATIPKAAMIPSAGPDAGYDLPATTAPISKPPNANTSSRIADASPPRSGAAWKTTIPCHDGQPREDEHSEHDELAAGERRAHQCGLVYARNETAVRTAMNVVIKTMRAGPIPPPARVRTCTRRAGCRSRRSSTDA